MWNSGGTRERGALARPPSPRRSPVTVQSRPLGSRYGTEVARMTRILVAWLVAALLCMAPVPDAAYAIVITFEATDLANTTPGEDLWRYVYTITDFSPVQDVAVETLFDHTLYRDLEDPAPGVAGWDILTLQPDSNLPDVGRYSALALSTGASLVEPFELTFVWLGGP